MTKGEKQFTTIIATFFSLAAGIVTFLMLHTGGGIDIESGIIPPAFWSAVAAFGVAGVVFIGITNAGEIRSRNRRAGDGRGASRRKRRRRLRSSA